LPKFSCKESIVVPRRGKPQRYSKQLLCGIFIKH
jgi:hypothetical protein